jgi:hypothetical protein
MEANRFPEQTRREARYGTSGKGRNERGEPICLMKGRSNDFIWLNSTLRPVAVNFQNIVT